MKFTQTHEWIETDGTTGTVGVTDYAQKELGDIVFVELPQVGEEVKAGEGAVVLESTKAAADIYSPVTGKIIAVNEALHEASELVNIAPEKDGWLFKVELSDTSELDKLMDSEQYLAQMG